VNHPGDYYHNYGNQSYQPDPWNRTRPDESYYGFRPHDSRTRYPVNEFPPNRYPGPPLSPRRNSRSPLRESFHRHRRGSISPPRIRESSPRGRHFRHPDEVPRGIRETNYPRSTYRSHLPDSSEPFYRAQNYPGHFTGYHGLYSSPYQYL
jgi:hypothetical protein